MSTNDVPGAVPANNDALRAGCWAEAEDGCLIYVYSTEGGKVYFDVYDTTVEPVTRYCDAMVEKEFKDSFSYDPKRFDTTDNNGRKIPMQKWTWHDKTAFPMTRVIKSGFREGQTDASAAATIARAERIRDSINRTQGGSSAQRIAQALSLVAQDLDETTLRDRAPSERGADMLARLKRAASAFIEEIAR